ncbi:unnamed protein product [Calicophoron daubneyi]|uniref:Lipocalin/cytosolic fatty-acid binding domain-containing protein n=1 Tax=Calicophoron daubneyi TaxID=300641 RepID=A0AAV2TU05_CALDB
MSAFVGDWYCTETENLGTLLTVLNANDKLKANAEDTRARLIISKLGAEKFNFKLITNSIVHQYTFQLGREFIEFAPEKQKFKTVITQESETQLKKVQMKKDIQVCILYDLVGNDKLIVTTSSGGTKATITFVRR